MNITPTPLEGCLLIQPRVISDERGYFMESFNEQTFKALTGMDVHFVQDNESQSTKGVLRGLHYQVGDFAQAKLVRVTQGAVWDVAVDIRPDSKTFGQHFGTLLSAEQKNQLFIPRGFAHGFLVLTDTAVFSYKCDNFYHKDSEAGIIWNDSDLQIDWYDVPETFIISEKDKNQPTFQNHRAVW